MEAGGFSGGENLCPGTGEEGPKRLGLRESCRGANLLGEHYPKLLRVGSGQEEGVLPEPSCPPHCPRNECSMSGGNRQSQETWQPPPKVPSRRRSRHPSSWIGD